MAVELTVEQAARAIIAAAANCGSVADALEVTRALDRLITEIELQRQELSRRAAAAPWAAPSARPRPPTAGPATEAEGGAN